jgi:hypothetical protein
LPKHYLGLFTVDSWREFKRHGGKIMGFNEKKASTVAKLAPGDRILCYLSKVSTFVGVLEVMGPSYFDPTAIWSDGIFPTRLPVQIILERSLSSAVPIKSLSGKLSFLPKAKNNLAWSVYVRSSPLLWKSKDAAVVVKALKLCGETEDQETATRAATRRIIKKQHYSTSTRVGRVIQRSEEIFETEKASPIGSYERAISGNKVTGYSVNVPIALTCQPTAVCLKTCYFATKAPSWSNSLRHQAKVYTSIKKDPVAFAERVALEYDSRDLTFLRWNGGGDLFPESVDVINYLGKSRPDIILWVVTRIPELAVQIANLKNVFIHFSLDKHSLARREKFLQLKPQSKNYFFSYQCEPDEIPDPHLLSGSAVLFFNNYKTTANLNEYRKEIVCPLNKRENISGVCVKCRRCFNGAAVRYEENTSAT